MPTDYSANLVKAKEETEARTVTRDRDNQANQPDYQSQSYRDQRPDVDLMREVYGGTKTMRAEGEKYLPKHPMEKQNKYDNRKDQAVAYNAVRRTVTGLSGMIFRRDPAPSEDVPPVMLEHAENIDMRGNKLPVFLRETAENALVDGHTWIHVESPPANIAENALDAERAGVRPYWINVTKRQAINWRYEIRNGRPVLTLFVYREAHAEPAGDFGESFSERVRVLREADDGVRNELWELREKEKGPDEWVMIEEHRVGVDEVPVVVLYAERSGLFTSRPPLLDLAYEQIEHYRVRSDRQKSMTFSSIAVPYVFGQDVTDKEGNAKIQWGPDGMLLVNDPEASAGIIESQGFGLEATKEELQEIKKNMAALGLRMLVDSRGTQPQTATSDVLEKAESDASLAAFAIALEDATNEALRVHADYERQINDPGTVEINRDFHDQLIDPQMLRTLSDVVASGHMSLDTMWEILVAGEVLSEDFDAEEERARIEQDGAAGLAEAEMSLFGGEVDEAA